MKRFIIRISLETIAIVAVTIVATLLVKNGYSFIGLAILANYGLFNLWRLSIERVNAQYDKDLKEAQKDLLRGRLANMRAQQRRLEAALVDAAVEALWVSDVEIRDDKVVYKIDVPGKGRIVVHLPNTKNDEDAPAASNKG